MQTILKSGFCSKKIKGIFALLVSLAFFSSTAFAQPANDNCGSAIALTPSTDLNCANPVTGTTVAATQSPETAPTCQADGIDDDVWYSFVATNAAHRVKLQNLTGGYIDADIAVYGGTCGNLTQIDCRNSDSLQVGSLVVGQTYYVRIYSFSNTTTNRLQSFQICITTPPPPPANDDCAAAITIPVNADPTCTQTVAGTTQNSTKSATEVTPNCGATGNNDDVWFKFTATNTNHKISLLNLTGPTPIDMAIEVYTGGCGALSSIGCAASATSLSLSDLFVGNTYYVRVWTTSAALSRYAAFDICVSTPPPPPSNDNCGGAVGLTVNTGQTCASATAGTTLNATPSNESSPTCSFAGTDDDVWYSFVAGGAAHIVTLSGTSGTFSFAVYSGSCGNLTQVKCNDGNNTTVGGLTAGQTYYVRVWTSAAAAAGGNFNICITTPPPPPANDNCAGAITVGVSGTETCATTTSSYTTNATESTDVAAPSCAVGQNDDVWFKFVATNTRHIVTVANTAGASNLATALYQGSCGTLSEVGCTPDNSHLYSGLSVGQTYYVRVWTESTSATTFSTFNICVGTPPPPPANDLCSGAIALTGSQTCTNQTFTTAWAGDSGVGDPGCGNYLGGDVWFSTVVPPSGLVKINTSTVSGSSLSDGAMAVYSGTCGNLVLVDCDQDSGPGNMPMLDLGGLTPGSTIYIRFWEEGNNQSGQFNICLTIPPSTPPPANDCDNAIALTVSANTTCTADVTATTLGALPSNAPAPSCAPDGVNDDVWFSFVATSPYHSITLAPASTGTSGNMAMAVYTGSCGSFVEKGCNIGNLFELNSLTVGQTYYIRVWTVEPNSPYADFGICVATPPTPPANDEPCSAIFIQADESGTCNYSTYTTTGALSSNVASPTCANYPGRDVWFKMVVPCTGNLNIKTNAMGFSDGAMAIYGGTCDNLTLIRCTDDGNGAMPMTATTGLTEGDTIYLRIWSTVATAQGEFGLCVSVPQLGGSGVCGDNIQAVPFCATQPTTIPSPQGQTSGQAPGGGIYGCLSTIPNPTWYYLQVNQTGEIHQQIIQISNSSGSPIDVDFVIWGPFPDVASACGQISAESIMDCSYSASGTEYIDMPSTQNLPHSNHIPQAGEVYVLLVTNYNGGAGQITFTPQPNNTGGTNCSAPCTVTATNTSPVCAGSNNLSLSASEIPGATYEWLGPRCFTSTDRVLNNVQVPTTPGNYVYTVTAVTDGTSPCHAQTIVEVIGAPQLGADTTVLACGGTTVDLTQIKNLVGIQHAWTMNGDTVVTPWAVQASGVYNVIGRNLAGCKDTTAVTVVMDSIKIATDVVNVGCLDNVGTVTVNASSGIGTYEYMINSGEATWQASNTFTNLALGNYIVSVRDSLQCVFTKDVAIKLDDGLFVKTIPDALLCTNGEEGITLTTESNGANFSWSPATGLNNPSLQSPVATPTENTTYVVTAILGTCIATDTVKVTVSEPVKVSAGPNKTVLIGESTILEGSVDGTATYLWTPSTDLSSVNILQPTVKPLNGFGDRVYVLTATNISGCSASDSMILTVIPYCVKVRNAFSPNGDGTNDTWMVYDTRDCFKNVEVYVYNRYGKAVYANKNYSNNWNGTYEGKPVPDGTYYAVVKFKMINNKDVEVKTDVNIIR